jgi:RNA recognition motif-containing protein
LFTSGVESSLPYAALRAKFNSSVEISLGRNGEEMVKKIYVGNLPFSATENEIRDLFAQQGTVESVKLITDRETGRARGFGFVEMDDAGAAAAIQSLNGTDLGGRRLVVNEARDREGGGGGGRDRRF